MSECRCQWQATESPHPRHSPGCWFEHSEPRTEAEENRRRNERFIRVDELGRSADGTIDRIVFEGHTYVRRNTVPPPNLNLAGYVGDWSDDYIAEARKNVDSAVAHSRAVAPLPPELLTADPDLMASPEGDVKGLRELQDAAREAIRGPV